MNNITNCLLPEGKDPHALLRKKEESCLKIQRFFRKNRVLKGVLLSELSYTEKELREFFIISRSWDFHAKKILDHVQRIKNSLASDYYAFGHGTRGSVGFFHDLYTGLDQQEGFVPLAQKRFRVPGVAKKFTNFEAYRNSEFSKEIDNRINHSMIACDGYLQSVRPNESAWSFFVANSSIMVNEDTLTSQLTSYVSRDTQIQKYLSEQIINGFNKVPKTGRYYLIAIPKAHLENPKIRYVWRAHSLGVICQCKNGSANDQFMHCLKENQKGNGRTCENGEIPQYRILAHNLDEDKEKKVFSFNTFEGDERKKYHEIVVKIKRKIRFFRNLESIQ